MPRSDGSCLNDALSALVGYEVGLADWVMGAHNPMIARELGLRYYENTNLELDESEDIVFVCPTTGKKAHAVYVPAGKVGRFLAQNTRQILCVFMR
jgi:hypothetical protein